jgi:hypothetical protein
MQVIGVMQAGIALTGYCLKGYDFNHVPVVDSIAVPYIQIV